MSDFLAFVECARCGEQFPVRSRMALNRAKWCSERCRKAQYDRACIDCGARIDGTTPGKAGGRCAKCANVETGRARHAAQRAAVERLWAKGLTAREIGVLMGWGKHASQYPAKLRARGYDLPHRRTPEQIARITAGSDAALAKARAVQRQRRKAAA